MTNEPFYKSFPHLSPFYLYLIQGGQRWLDDGDFSNYIQADVRLLSSVCQLVFCAVCSAPLALVSPPSAAFRPIEHVESAVKPIR